jgi:hypothetical protein
MERYAVEVYAPGRGDADVRAAAERLRHAARALTREGRAVTYRRSLFLPTDETAFHILDGVSRTAVRETVRRAALDASRIVLAAP